MSLERKDLRIKLDPDVHAQMSAIADVDGKDLAEFAEAVIAAEVRRRVHATKVLAAKLQRLGLAGQNGE